jgi:hyperosmotically inducible protein
MRNYLSNALVVGVLFLLGGCQTGTSPGMFSSYSSSPSSPPSPPSPFFSSGMSLAQTVQNALSRSEDPVIARVHVETNQNIVILSGYVKKIRQSDVAEQIARQVSGGQNVQNNIIIRQ